MIIRMILMMIPSNNTRTHKMISSTNRTVSMTTTMVTMTLTFHRIKTVRLTLISSIKMLMINITRLVSIQINKLYSMIKTRISVLDKTCSKLSNINSILMTIIAIKAHNNNSIIETTLKIIKVHSEITAVIM